MIDYNTGALNIDSSSLGSFDFSQLGGNLLYYWLGFVLVLMAGVTFVLYYHWLRYAFGNKAVMFAQVLYTCVLLISFGVIISSLYVY